MKNLLRVMTVTPQVHLGNVKQNVAEIRQGYETYCHQADLILYPELCLTGYTCQDLFANRNLIDGAMKGLLDLAGLTVSGGEAKAALVVGLPVEYRGELLNCAAILQDGRVWGLVPKTYLPNYSEFYEKRWFGAGVIDAADYRLPDGTRTRLGNNLLFRFGTEEDHVTVGVELCEDCWTPIPPSRMLTLAGAEVILNLSASNEVIGKADYRRTMLSQLSASCICGYVYASAGRTESTSDLVFSGHDMIYEDGKLLGEIKPFDAEGDQNVLMRDIRLTKIRHDRLANRSFSDCRNAVLTRTYETILCPTPLMEKTDYLGKVKMLPFVPGSNQMERCLGIFRMQVAGLQRRMEITHCKCVVVGVSGGLDSTLALLVAAQAVRNMHLPATTLIGITMPGFGTTERTKNNSLELMRLLGCEIRTISIVDAVRQHFHDIGHDESILDVTYENCQARERTQILMDVANKNGGFVVGTGDLSELALGWCTYNGDHMSMYAVNTSVPKTLVRTLVDQVGHHMNDHGFAGLSPVVEDIIDTPVSPELLPPNPDGTIAQKTEDTVGSYILHDFFLYYHLRFGMAPEEIYDLCREAVRQNPEYAFSDAEIRKWMNTFYTRFFRQQFKRNCMPDGVKIGSVSVSPRGDLRLPSEIEEAGFLLED